MKNRKNRHNDANPVDKSTTDGVIDAAIEIFALGLSSIRDEIESIKAGTAAKSRRDPAARIASLTARVGAIADSVRKVEAARAKRLDGLTPATVLAWLRQLPASERLAILREAEYFDKKGSGLG